MLEDIKENINVNKRNFLLIKLFPMKIGKFDVLDNNIIFYIFPEDITNARSRKTDSYELKLNGIIGNSSISPETIRKYDINKPVYYILDGINFRDYPVNIKCTGDVIVIISNCTFEREIKISDAKQVMFSHNKYYNSLSNDSFFEGDFITTEGKIDKFVFRNEKFINLSKKKGSHFGLSVRAEEVVIKDTVMESNNGSKLIINANKLEMERSFIETEKAYIYTNSYTDDNNVLSIKKGFLSGNNLLVDFEMSNFKNEIEKEIKKIK